jgi:hypothetical protein
VVGLDATDMGISGARSVEFAWGVWWVVNQSTKRPVIIEQPARPAYQQLPPGHRYAVTSERVNVLVPGAICTHVLEARPGAEYAQGLRRRRRHRPRER